MKAVNPRNARERLLKKKEDWKTALAVDQYWQSDNCICDLEALPMNLLVCVLLAIKQKAAVLAKEKVNYIPD
jgi:hypothetical protein